MRSTQIKGGSEFVKVYFAGKIKHKCWRHDIVPELDSVFCSSDSEPPKNGIPMNNHDGLIYVGPFFVARDHGCYDGEETHCVGLDKVACSDYETSAHKTKEICLQQIQNADAVFCWLDDPTAYGTLVEIGYAKGAGKKVIIATPNRGELQDLWLSFEIADRVYQAKDAQTGWELAKNYLLRGK